jgi:hypothetical protein
MSELVLVPLLVQMSSKANEPPVSSRSKSNSYLVMGVPTSGAPQAMFQVIKLPEDPAETAACRGLVTVTFLTAEGTL